jgi:cytosine/adenosine deaminase-related metal-dependent hydrolase
LVKVLIDKASILTLSSVTDPWISEGYVYASNGKIRAVGKGEPPEELKYPELLLNGRGRVVTPGLSSGFTIVSLYPLRYRGDTASWSEWVEYYRRLSRTDMYYISGMAFLEMVMRGVTSALVSDIYLDNVARAAVDVGLYVTLAPPFNCGLDEFSPENELRLLLSRWHEKVPNVRASILTCGDPTEEVIELAEKHSLPVYVLSGAPGRLGERAICINSSGYSCTKNIFYGEGSSRWVDGSGLGMGVRASYSMFPAVKEAAERTGAHPLDVLNAAVNVNPKLLGFSDYGALDVGNTANLVMFNTSEPPGWPQPSNLKQLINALVYGDLRVESVIIGENVVVDSAESLTLGYDFISKARSRLEPLVRELQA